MGGAAVFFRIAPETAFLSDTNERLVRTFRGVQQDADGVIEILATYPYDRDFYLELRGRAIDDATDVEVAAWFIYLNKCGYNGLYRVNSKNIFNVPFGNFKTTPNYCNRALLRAAAERLSGVELTVQDFAAAAERARPGDLVYFDPPYVPLNTTSSFTSYTKDGFDHPAQERLRDVALALKSRGVHVLLSNSSAEPVYALYQDDFELIEVHARRSINSKTDARGPVKELLIK